MSDLSAIQRAKEQIRADEAAAFQDEIAERVAAAEARGYDRAIANLRNDEGRGAAAQIMRDAGDDLNGRTIAQALADYLEAQKENPGA
jgi:hypothetical protein